MRNLNTDPELISIPLDPIAFVNDHVIPFYVSSRMGAMNFSWNSSPKRRVDETSW